MRSILDLLFIKPEERTEEENKRMQDFHKQIMENMRWNEECYFDYADSSADDIETVVKLGEDL